MIFSQLFSSFLNPVGLLIELILGLLSSMLTDFQASM